MSESWWRKLLGLVTAKRRRPAGSQQLDKQRVQMLMEGVLSTQDDELGCDECFELVDRFAEMVRDGMDAAEAMPLVQDHLDRCPGCREEFEALLDALAALD